MIEINKKYGCLTVLDDGSEYKEKEFFAECIAKYETIERENLPLIQELKALIKNNPEQYEMELQGNPNKNFDFHVEFIMLSERLQLPLSKMKYYGRKIKTHYKCQCKCGRIQYYDEYTIKSKPKYCFYPVPISTKWTYSVAAQNATARKQKKYDGIECIVLRDKKECFPSDEYCDYYNKYKVKQLTKSQEKLDQEISRIPRVYAPNYEIDYTGKQYESLFVEECVDDHLESKPVFSFTQSHKKHWHNIIVYKKYRCTCTVCGKEHYVTCNDFGINAPTEYGYRAFDGYWSEIKCDCHPISSFQWIVNKLLFENNIPYKVEYSFADLYGKGGRNLLKFDFAIFDTAGALKCLIECQGEQHYMPVEEFGGEKQFLSQKLNDELKREYVTKHGLKLIEISYKNKEITKVRDLLQKEGIIEVE